MLAAMVAVLMVAGAGVASAQCVRFSHDAPCARLTQPSVRLDVSASQPAPNGIVPNRVSPQAGQSESGGVDCRMVKPVDPKFYSAMPVMKPDPNVLLPMKVIQAPACKP